MVNSEDIHPFVVAVACCLIIVFAPLLLNETLVSALTATPLRWAASAFVVLGVGGVVALWAVSRASLRAASAVEGERTQGGQS